MFSNIKTNKNLQLMLWYKKKTLTALNCSKVKNNQPSLFRYKPWPMRQGKQ
jgi:hypothetical protein